MIYKKNDAKDILNYYLKKYKCPYKLLLRKIT